MDLFGEPEAPEPDELEEFDAPFIEEAGEFFAHPRLSLGALGHENIENHIHEMFKNGRLHHGLIFSGPKGIGKATTAYKQHQDVANAEAKIAGIQEEVEAIRKALERDVEEIGRTFDPFTLPLEKETLKPTRTDVRVERVGLLWM